MFEDIEWRDYKPGEELEDSEIAEAIDRCICLLNKHPESPASAIGLGEMFVKVERLMKPNMYRVLQGRITKYGFVPPIAKEKPKQKYVPEFLEYVKANAEAVADLIEAIKKAQVIGFDGDHFSNAATCDILSKLHKLIPGMKDLIQNEDVRKYVTDCLTEGEK